MQIDEGVVMSVLQVIALSATATWLVQLRRTKWLPVVGMVAAIAFSGWWLVDDSYPDTPVWYSIFISVGYTAGTIASAHLAKVIAGGVVSQFVLTVIGGFLSLITAVSFGFVLWTMS